MRRYSGSKGSQNPEGNTNVRSSGRTTFSMDLSSKQVQFGTPARNVPSEDSVIDREKTENEEETSEDVNRRLRHHRARMGSLSFEKYKRFGRLKANICIVLIQICYQEVSVIRLMNKLPKVEVNLEFVPLEEKYGLRDPEMVIEPNESYLSNNKFKKDLSWIASILHALIVNLQKDYYFDDFLKILKDHELTKQEENTILGSKEFSRRQLEKLKLYIETGSKEGLRVIQKVTEMLGNTKDQLNDNLTENAVKIKYLKDWEEARQEQNEIILKQKERTLLATFEGMNLETLKEARVHDEMWLFLENSVKDYMEQIETWMEKYDQDIEDHELKVGKMKAALEYQRLEYETLMDKYKEREKMISEYNQYKLKLKQEAEELERRRKAATKIQSWWRGIMFRKGLGPFRRKKGKGKRGGSGKQSAKGGSERDSAQKRKK